MANVLFKRGLSTSLTTAAPIEGAFYLTTDTDKLYVGKRISEDEEVKIVELNRCIISVDKASDIVNPVVDQFYYIEEGNILAYWDGEKLNQINSTKDVADRVTAVEGKVKTVEDVLNGTDAEGEQGTEGYKPATNGLISDVEDLKVAVGVGQDGEGSITDRVNDLEDIINGIKGEPSEQPESSLFIDLDQMPSQIINYQNGRVTIDVKNTDNRDNGLLSIPDSAKSISNAEFTSVLNPGTDTSTLKPLVVKYNNTYKVFTWESEIDQASGAGYTLHAVDGEDGNFLVSWDMPAGNVVSLYSYGSDAEISFKIGSNGQPGLVDRVDALEDAIEVINGEGEGSIKRAAEGATANAIAQLISDSEENPIDEKFDTLKEIADWILTTNGEDGLTAAERIDSLEDAVGTPSKKAEGEPDSEDYKPAEPATGLYKEIEDINNTISGLDATVSNAETDPIHVTVTQTDGKLTKVTVATDMFTWGEF